MNKVEPLVSIIIPLFNRESLIGHTLDSIICQTYENWECIIVDDGSDDDSLFVVKKYILKDSRILLYKRDKNPKGAPTCRNIGFLKSKGKYINWFDSDDIMLPNFIRTKVELLEQNGSLDFVVSKIDCFKNDINNKMEMDYDLKSKNILYSFLKFTLRFYTPGPMFKRKFLEKQNKLFDESLPKHQESEFHFNLILQNPNYEVFNEVTSLYRLSESSISFNSGGRKKNLINDYIYFLSLNSKIEKIKQNSYKAYILMLYKTMGFASFSINIDKKIYKKVLIILKEQLSLILPSTISKIFSYCFLHTIIQLKNKRFKLQFKKSE